MASQDHRPLLFVRSAIFSRLLAVLSLATLCLGQSCNLDTCNAACISWETANTFCQNDFQPWDSKISCQCEYPYHSIGTGSLAANLNQCVACNVANVGPHPLSYYQIWAFICDTYASYGEPAAVAAAGNADAAVIQAFSATLLPQVTASYCGAAVVVTSSTSTSRAASSSSTIPRSTSTSPAVVISSSSPSSASAPGTSAASRTSSSSSTAQSTTAASPTPNSAARHGSVTRRTMMSAINRLEGFLAVVPIGVGLCIVILLF